MERDVGQGKVVDLMAALERSLKEARAHRDRVLGGPYFVMLAGQPKKADSHIYVFGEGATVKDAHRSAEATYRKDRSLPSSVYVVTQKLAEVATFKEAQAFVARLEEVMADAE